MRLTRRYRAIVIAAAAAVAVALPCAASAHAPTTITVTTDAQFQTAVHRLAQSGGTIILRPHRYDTLTIAARSASPLHIVGDGASVRRLHLIATRHVTVSGLRITAAAGHDAAATVSDSSDVTFSHVVVHGTKVLGASIALERSTDVRITHSEFTACGDYQGPAPGGKYGICLRMQYSRNLTVSHNSFHDCFGCDFLHAWAPRHLQVTQNTFERALFGPCGHDPARCNHNDLVQLRFGSDIALTRNVFGVTAGGAAQVYIANHADGVRIANNLFRATDSTVPDLVEHDAIKLGNEVGAPTDQPLRVVIEQNTILAGAPRPDGVENSIILSTPMAQLSRAEQPLIANNVIAMTHTPARLCGLATLANNVLIEGELCGAADTLGDPHLTAGGRPTRDSTLLIGRALLPWVTLVDLLGGHRDARPDIGAFEYGAGR